MEHKLETLEEEQMEHNYKVGGLCGEGIRKKNNYYFMGKLGWRNKGVKIVKSGS